MRAMFGSVLALCVLAPVSCEGHRDESLGDLPAPGFPTVGVGGSAPALGSTAQLSSTAPSFGDDRDFKALRSGEEIVLSVPPGLSHVSDPVQLLARHGDAWEPVMQRVGGGRSTGYYLDGRFVPPRRGLGADLARCAELSARYLSATEVVVVAERGAPTEWQEFVARRNQLKHLGNTRKPSNALLPDAKTRVLEDGLVVRVRYFDSPDCSGSELVQQVPVRTLPPPPPPPITASRGPEGIKVKAPFGVWYYPCFNEPQVLKRSGGKWIPVRDDRPSRSNHGGYYVDSVYVRAACDSGCGSDQCEALVERNIDPVQRILVGHRQDPGWASRWHRPCGPGKESDIAPAFRSQPALGELAIEITFYDNAACAGLARTVTVPVTR